MPPLLFGLTVGGGLVGLLLLVGWVVFVLPDRIPSPVGAQNEADYIPVPAARRAEQSSPFAEAQRARRREAALTASEALIKAHRAAEAKGVQAWLPDEYLAAEEVAAAGDMEFQRSEYEAAEAGFKEATGLFEGLVTRAERLFDESIGNGNAALEAGDKAAAIEAFEMALVIEPGNETAMRGMQRAEVVDQVYPLMREGHSLYAAGRLDAAMEKYRAAEKLDAVTAAPEIRKVNEALVERQYQAAMASGRQAQTAGDLAGARSQFERALDIKPGAGEARNALSRVADQMREQRVDELLAAAERYEAAENWPEAARQYQAVLALEPDRTDLQNKVKELSDLASLVEGISRILSNPQQLVEDQQLYINAQKLVRAAEQIENKGPELTARIAELEKLIAAKNTPIPVRFQSDQKTRVTVMRVGNFGTFNTHEELLFPGEFTAIGQRDGYRDVRVVFTVKLDGTTDPSTIEVVCLDQV